MGINLWIYSWLTGRGGVTHAHQQYHVAFYCSGRQGPTFLKSLVHRPSALVSPCSGNEGYYPPLTLNIVVLNNMTRVRVQDSTSIQFKFLNISLNDLLVYVDNLLMLFVLAFATEKKRYSCSCKIISLTISWHKWKESVDSLCCSSCLHSIPCSTVFPYSTREWPCFTMTH